MTVTGLEHIQPIIFGCSLWALGKEPPVNLDIDLVGTGLDGYLQNKGAYYQFCDNVTTCFKKKTKDIAGSSNPLRFTLTWRDDHMDKTLGEFNAAASLEAAKQAVGQPPTGTDYVG